jgi:hypothetical protein
LALSTILLALPRSGVAGTPATTTDPLVASNLVASTALVREIPTVPRINRRVPERLRSKIESGFRLAVERVRQVPACNGLFAELDADGIQMLSTTLYYKAELKMELKVCPGALAYTLVDGAPTWLCRRFERLSDERAAAVLLHEALHHAGMDEWPHDPEAAPASAIDAMVKEACGF